MKKMIVALCALLLAYMAVPEVIFAKTNDSYTTHANLTTWLWDTSEIVRRPNEVIQDLSNHSVKELRLQIDPTIQASYYKTFISKANANGIKVQALDGAPQWVAAKGVELQQAFVNWLKDYQKKAKANEQFTGIHLDVEPYENEDFEEHSDSYLEAYQAMMLKFKAYSNELGITFGIDIPFWFYGVKYVNKYGTGNIAEWLCQHVKLITIMAYRDIAGGDNGIISIAAKEMKLFKQYNVRGTIAVETGRLAASNNFVTFYEESKAYMDQQLEIVYDSYKTHSEFNGIAIHYYDSWMQMK